MPRFSSPFDGADLFYRDYVPAAHPVAFRPASEPQEPAGSKPALIFIHGWPMNSLTFEQLMLPLCETHRYRCIATDRRGFGHSDWRGFSEKPADISYETFADDAIYLLEKLKIESFIFLAASMGCGETILAFQRSRFVQDHCKVPIIM
jgi:non-heme chloroperoxidase